MIDNIIRAYDHELKILPSYFNDVIRGAKKFEIRSTLDRNFKVGDFVKLCEWCDGHFTGRFAAVQITYVLNDHVYLDPDACIFSFVYLGVFYD